ncbi:hypothetical protein BLNAU_1372 [Blattamonas nauphoetae]|uniref:Uncharacterized protein n=1 Tax=Blattamonas nauphoetae TaxID=2049346 RepID=A0ABQ9Y0E3_9EUKA|nr:hypothetical protein BLNAU_7807 [Blattamonas nauphoetae]KAK2963803.1 hypothetical protein BLNAU_1372 [Blattamonas nauphoetae]
MISQLPRLFGHAISPNFSSRSNHWYFHLHSRSDDHPLHPFRKQIKSRQYVASTSTIIDPISLALLHTGENIS